MNLEELKDLLSSGKITEEQFNYLSLNMQSDSEENKDTNNVLNNKADVTDENNSKQSIEDLVNQAVKKATESFENANRELKEQLANERKKNLSAEELKKLEISEKEKELADREKALKVSENKLFAIKELKKAGLDDGNESSLELIDFVMANNETDISTRITTFKRILDNLVKTKVDKIFKDGGRSPEQGFKGSNVNNPYSKESFDFTKQMELEIKNPELAQILQK